MSAAYCSVCSSMLYDDEVAAGRCTAGRGCSARSRNVGAMRFLCVDAADVAEPGEEPWDLGSFIANNTQHMTEDDGGYVALAVNGEVLECIDNLMQLNVGERYTHNAGCHGITHYRRVR